MLKQFRLLTRPTLARQDAPFPDKAGASEGRRRTLWGYVEDFDDRSLRTNALADCFSILLGCG